MDGVIHTTDLRPEDRTCDNCKDAKRCPYDKRPVMDPVLHRCYGHVHELDYDFRDNGNYDLFLQFMDSDHPDGEKRWQDYIKDCVDRCKEEEE